MHIVPLSEIPIEDVETLLDIAFGSDRRDRTAYKLRAGTNAISALGFAAIDEEGALLGTIQCWPVGFFATDGRLNEAMVLVGPVAVAPQAQGRGAGKALMDAVLAAAPGHADGPLMMIGDPGYYTRFFGFSPEATAAWQLPGPVERHRLLARSVRGEAIPREGILGPRRTP